MATQEEIKNKLFSKVIENVAFEGWSKENLRKASIALGYPDDYAELLFSEGIIELIEKLINQLDAEMVNEFNKKVTENWGITRKVKEALIIRFKLMNKNKLVYIRTIQYLALPWNSIKGVHFAWKTADFIWSEIIGDQSTDYNYYSKRALLAGVYSAALFFFMSDDSEHCKDTFDFIERRVDNVVNWGKKVSKLKAKNL